MRHSATRALLERDDVIIVASVSCIYGIGSVETYTAMTFTLKKGRAIDQRQLLADLVALQYKRNDDMASCAAPSACAATPSSSSPPTGGPRLAHLAVRRRDRGDHRVRSAHRPEDRRAGAGQDLRQLALRDAAPDAAIRAIKSIKSELKQRLEELNAAGRLLEAQRLEQRTTFDIEMMDGHRLLRRHRELFALSHRPQARRAAADPVRIPARQRAGLHRRKPRHRAADRRHVRGDFRRKATLAEYGFRLPSCMDNRPLRFEEWDAMRPQTVYVSATPAAGRWSRPAASSPSRSSARPASSIRPSIIRPAKTQVDDARRRMPEDRAKKGYRTLVTVLTKRMAEDLTEYLHEQGVRVRYMHSDIDTLERIEIIRDLRLGAFDVLVGINLLREGLDIPECALVAILDADKEGFLRSETSLIQTIGRAARNVDGKVILYADKITGSMERAMAETNRRREKQVAYNEASTASRRKHQETSATSSTASTSATTSRQGFHKACETLQKWYIP
jgi:excinuclease ABC subunit B